jgi:outer membrane protein OmpA-like peptidoglycan-associated protein
MALLDEILQALQANLNVPVTIHGHASSEGSSTVNLKLSEDRAAAVRDYLVARGADPNRFIVIGHGDTQPVASNSTEEGRARNRRIEFEALLEELTAEEEP